MPISPYHLHLGLSNLPRRRRKRASRQHLRPPSLQEGREANGNGIRTGPLLSSHPLAKGAPARPSQSQQRPMQTLTRKTPSMSGLNLSSKMERRPHCIHRCKADRMPSTLGAGSASHQEQEHHVSDHLYLQPTTPQLIPQSTLTIQEKNCSTGPPSQAAGDHLEMTKPFASNAGNSATTPPAVASGTLHAPGA